MSSENQSTPDTDGEILQEYNFTAGKQNVQAKPTPYGKWVEDLDAMTKQALQEKGQTETDNEENLAIRQALDDARGGNYESLMRCCLWAVNISHTALENIDPDELTLNPTEAEKIFIAMGNKQFPELNKAGFAEVRELWKTTGRDVPDEYFSPQNRDMKKVLPTLRNDLEDMMNRSRDLLAPSAGKEGVKLCYAMMMLERSLAESVGQITHPDMTMLDRSAADEERKKLS